MATKQLSKAQLAVIDRLGGGERIEKSWMGRTYYGNNHKAVPLTTVMVLVNGGYIKRTDVVTHFRHYHVLTLTDAGRALYAARHAPAEQPTGLLDGLNDLLAALAYTANQQERETAKAAARAFGIDLITHVRGSTHWQVYYTDNRLELLNVTDHKPIVEMLADMTGCWRKSEPPGSNVTIYEPW